MNKFLCLISLLLILQNYSKAQNVSGYYDSKFIKEHCFDDIGNRLQNKTNLVSILKKYYPGVVTDATTGPELVTLLKSNPFLKDLTPGGFPSAPIPLIGSGGFSFSSLGNIDVTNIVDGFAKFIVERTKKELQAAYFDKFIKELSKPKYDDARTLFPSTWRVVQQLPTDVYNYEKYIQSLRDAFGKDMETILPNVEQVLKNGRFKDFFNRHLELKSICLTALHFGKGLQKGKHIGMLLEEYNPSSHDYDFGSANADTIRTNAIEFIQEVSKSLRTLNAGEKKYWVPADSIMMMINDPITFNIYLGLLYARVNHLKVCNSSAISYGGAMANINGSIEKLKSMVENIADQVSNVQSAIDDLKEKAKDEKGIDLYIAYFNSATKMIESFKENEFIRNIGSLLPPDLQTDIELYWKQYSNIIDAANAILSIYTSIKEKNYSVAISNVRALYQMRYEPAKANDATTGNDAQKIITFLLDKGTFIASVAQAKTSDEVRDAINMVAMPSGSARVKRLSSFNVAINAYCGLFTGFEKIRNVDKDFKINSYGLTAPIGVTISMGTKKGWSHSILISVVDIGAVASFRFTNDTTAQVPTIQLKNILSPGLFYSLGIRRSPLSVNIGAQVGPNLRKVTSTTNDYSNNTYMRYSISFCVDLPLFNLYSKTR